MKVSLCSLQTIYMLSFGCRAAWVFFVQRVLFGAEGKQGVGLNFNVKGLQLEQCAFTL